jgi:hypothetical protein
MFRKLTFLWFMIYGVCVSSSSSGAKPEVVDQQSADGFAYYTLVVPSSRFTKDYLTELCHQYLEQHATAKLLHVGIFADPGAARDSLGKGMSHFTYDEWKQQFESRSHDRTLIVAELLKYGGAATLRVRFADGRVEETPLTADDVFHSSINGVALNLLWVAYSREGFGNSEQLIPILYFTIPKPASAEEASVLAVSIWRTSGIPRIETRIRQDQWFVFDAHYPWKNPFTSIEVAPHEAEAAQSVEFLCKPWEKQACYVSSRPAR